MRLSPARHLRILTGKMPVPRVNQTGKMPVTRVNQTGKMPVPREAKSLTGKMPVPRVGLSRGGIVVGRNIHLISTAENSRNS
jgi:hypothetical protein